MRANVKWAVVAALLVLALGTTGVVYAITNGAPDGNNHPYVGMVLLYDASGDYAGRCSGALIAENVVLTAGHCTSFGVTRARVLFEPDLTSLVYPYDTCAPYTCYEGTTHTYPGGFAAGDVGVVVLDEPVSMPEMAALPGAGLVDTLKNKADLDLVGYGVQYEEQIPGNELPPPPPLYRWIGLEIRMYAPSQLVRDNPTFTEKYIKVTMNPGGGTGGFCYGDSGSPDLLGGTNTVVAINTNVSNYNCTGVGYSFRVDRPEVLAWINSFMP